MILNYVAEVKKVSDMIHSCTTSSGNYPYVIPVIPREEGVQLIDSYLYIRLLLTNSQLLKVTISNNYLYHPIKSSMLLLYGLIMCLWLMNGVNPPYWESIIYYLCE